jgi:ComF family protein
LQGVRAAAHLSGPLRQAVHSFKYKGLRALTYALGAILYDCWSAEPWVADTIVPVPLHPQRQHERGYNQSALLARSLADQTDVPIVEGVLLRITPTPPQVGLSAAERAENVRNAFACRDESLKGCKVLLVDDVLTTGATLRSCAHALLAGEACLVWGLTLAHD